VDGLNDRIKEGNRELREIRMAKRAALESEEAKVRFSIMWLMPILVSALGITLFVRRKGREMRAGRSNR
jgi:paraquat-inducible protein B